MRTTRLMIVLMPAVLSILPLIANAGRSGSGYGNWPDQHGRIAARQVEQNFFRACRFRGGRRYEKLRNCQRHYNGYEPFDQHHWRYNNSYARGVYNSRSAFADYYASTAVRQARRNLRWGCGYYGERWVSQYNRHYRYGYKTRRYRAESEIDVRNHMLNECRGGGYGH